MASPTGAFFVNGRDMADFKLTLQSLQGPWDSPARTPLSVIVHGRSGSIRTHPDDVVKPRQAKLGGLVIGTNRADVITQLDNLKTWLSDGTLSVIWGDRLGVEWYMRLLSLVVSPFPAQYESSAVRVAIDLETDYDNLGYEVAPTVVSFGATRVACQTGTASCAPRIILSNAIVVAAPVQSAIVGSTTGGTLAAATYYYVVTATTAAGETVRSNEQSVVNTGTTSSNTISWAAVTGVTGYNVYRGTAAGTEGVYYAAGNVVSFVDTGAASTAGTPPTINTALPSVTNPVLTYRNSGGDVVQAMTFTGTLAAGESLDVNCLLMQINRTSAAGGRTSARSWLTAGTYFSVRSSDGHQPNAVYPTLEVSATGGTLAGLAILNRTYY